MLKQQKNYYQITNINATLFIKSTFNNIIINLYIQNKMIFCKSCGNKLIKGSQRHTLYAVQLLIENLKDKLYYYKIKNLKIYFKGISYKNYYIIKNLFNFKIQKIINLTNLPHNGCKLKKKKRR
jgi:ribosomal protein S11